MLEMVGHHTPDETGQFSCSSNYSEGSGLSGGNGAIFSFQSFIAFVGIGNHFGIVSPLAFQQMVFRVERVRSIELLLSATFGYVNCLVW